MPDGTVIAGVPDGVTRSQLMARYSQISSGDSSTTDPVSAAYEGTINAVAKPINSAVSNVTGAIIPSAVSSIPFGPQILDAGKKAASNIAQEGAEGTANALDTTESGKEIGDYLLDTKKYMEANPDAQKRLDALTENAKLAANMAVLKPAGDIAAGIGENAAKALERPDGNFPSTALPPSQNLQDLSTNAHAALSDAYGKSLNNSNKYYNFMQSLGEGKTIDSTDLKNGINGIISDIQTDPFHEGRTALPKLQSIADRIGDDGQIGVNDVVDLKKMLNTQFNPKRFMEAKDTPYANLANTTDNTLEAAAKLYPDFGEAKSIADRNWVNNVAMPFRNNEVLQRFWKPEDYHAAQSVKNGLAEDVPDITKERASEMLNGVSNPTELDAVTRALPDDIADQFRQGVLQNTTQGNGGSRLLSAGKAAYYGATGRLPTALSNAASALKTYSPEDQALIDAAKKPSPRLAGKYEDQYQNLKTNSSDDEYENALNRLQQISTQPLAITEASGRRPMVGNGPDMRPMTDEEWQNSISGNQRQSEIDLNPDVRAAQEARKTNEINARNQNARTLNDIAQGRGASELGQAVINEGNPPLKDYEDSLYPFRDTSKDGFKRGGSVKPTEAQKSAGNYKKEHLKIHGLDISIENLKGSIRSGKGKDGKEWSVKMPHHYGYIKGTVGKDNDHVDCFIGPNKHSLRVYIIDQKNHETGKFDEHKVMISFPDRESAIKAYKDSFSDNKNRIMHVRKMLMPEFKEWLSNGNTKKPVKAA